MSGLISTGAEWLRGRFAALTAPARDPRSVYSNPLEPHYESLTRLREARGEVRRAIDRLSEMAARATDSLDRIDASSESARDPGMPNNQKMPGHYMLELKFELNDELSILNRKIESLSNEHRSLLGMERRLISSIRRGAVSREMEDATSASREAKQAAAETFAGLDTELLRLDRAIGRAHAMGRELETRDGATNRTARIDSPEDRPEGRERDSASATERQAMNIVRRYTSAVEEMSVDAVNSAAVTFEQGLKVARGLLYEYQQFRSLLDRTDWPEEREAARLTIMIELACRHGLGRLETVYRQTLAATSDAGSMAAAGATERALVDAEACERTMRQARLEILQADQETSSDVLVTVTNVIRRTMAEFEGNASDLA